LVSFSPTFVGGAAAFELRPDVLCQPRTAACIVHGAHALVVLPLSPRKKRTEDGMKAVTWQGKREIRVETVPDPVIHEPTDAIVRITTTAICGSDLHLYEVLPPFMRPGDILGHEPMGIVEAVGSNVPNLSPGDRVVIHSR
jgi:hypothetical protein